MRSRYCFEPRLPADLVRAPPASSVRLPPTTPPYTQPAGLGPGLLATHLPAVQCLRPELATSEVSASSSAASVRDHRQSCCMAAPAPTMIIYSPGSMRWLEAGN